MPNVLFKLWIFHSLSKTHADLSGWSLLDCCTAGAGAAETSAVFATVFLRTRKLIFKDLLKENFFKIRISGKRFPQFLSMRATFELQLIRHSSAHVYRAIWNLIKCLLWNIFIAFLERFETFPCNNFWWHNAMSSEKISWLIENK